jgi:predicted HAD superfamily phosphohydrolase
VPRDVLTPDQWIEQYNEIFAELIVKECVKICETMTLLGPYKEIQDVTLQDAAQQILEHFGVK